MWYFWQGNHHTYGHIRCVYTVLANPIYIKGLTHHWQADAFACLWCKTSDKYLNKFTANCLLQKEDRTLAKIRMTMSSLTNEHHC